MDEGEDVKVFDETSEIIKRLGSADDKDVAQDPFAGLPEVSIKEEPEDYPSANYSDTLHHAFDPVEDSTIKLEVSIKEEPADDDNSIPLDPLAQVSGGKLKFGTRNWPSLFQYRVNKIKCDCEDNFENYPGAAISTCRCPNDSVKKDEGNCSLLCCFGFEQATLDRLNHVKREERIQSSMVFGRENSYYFKDSFQCFHCDFKAGRKGKLRAHVNTIHKGEGPLQCSSCDYRCSKRYHLVRHNAVHKTRKYSPSFPDTYICDEEKLNDFDTVEKPFQCCQCSYGTNIKKNLDRHVNVIHKKEKPFRCVICGYKARERTMILRHVSAVHQGVKPFHCSQCVYRTDVKRNLDRHIKCVHMRERPHQCALCDYRAGERGAIFRHVSAVHKGERPYRCSDCDYRSAGKRNLNRHISAVHKGEKPFECPLCLYKSNGKRNLLRHFSAKHKSYSLSIALEIAEQVKKQLSPVPLPTLNS